MKFNLFLFFLLVGPLLLSAQPAAEYSETTSAKKSLRFAQQFINEGNLKEAKKQLRNTIKLKEDFAVAYREMGMVCLELKDYKEAIKAYEMSFELDEKLSRAAFFECGESHFKSGDQEMAMYYFQKYMDTKDERYANKQKESGLEVKYDLMLPERLQNCKYLKTLDTTGVSTYAQNLGEQINSKEDDYLPTITGDGTYLVYTRTEKGGNQNIYKSQWTDGKWSKGRSFGKQLNTEQNEGMAKFEAHGRSFYFAGCMREDTDGGCDIYQASLTNGEINSVHRVDGALNSSYWDSQPSITCDGKSMYFSSTRKGGQGGADIWVSHLQKNGEWSYPQNLGSAINSDGDEEAPYISNDGQTLYFSSTRPDGQGDGDLFLARYDGSSWSPAINMGYPINSTSKELGIYVQADGKTAYFSSARGQGEGGLDIYSIELPESLRPAPIVQLEGQVIDRISQEPVASTVKISRKAQQMTIKTDEEGWFFLCLPGDKGYSFQIDEKGYDYLMEAQFLGAQDNTHPIKVQLELNPIGGDEPDLVAKGVPTIKEKRIQFYFDFDSYELTEKSIQDLTDLAELLHREKDWQLEVVGYADQQGDHQYNLRLSQQRARKIVDFLNHQGIDIKQVVRNEGKGSLKESKEESLNRRVDVVLRR